MFREKIRERISREPNLQLLFLESRCDDPAVIAANIALKVQSGDPDYKGMSREEAERDFRRRIDAYERVYQTITEPSLSFCRIINVGQMVTINRIQGYLQSRIAFYLMNLHLKPRSIYLSRVSQLPSAATSSPDMQHGESVYNVEGKIGGDSDLSPRGWEYAKALPELIKKNIGEGPLEVSQTLHPAAADATGLDLDPATDSTNGIIPAVREEDVEIAGRTRCGCV
jgi:6-phosphofructo-2-kinase/fructose-2,6-biphosphatase 2